VREERKIERRKKKEEFQERRRYSLKKLKRESRFGVFSLAFEI